jgi:2-hydroxychromene-2-carboxylate isomerase
MIFGVKPIGTTMDRPNTILVYSDYKSPYAFLAKDLIYELEDQFDVHLEWCPTRSTFQAISEVLD